MRISEYIKMLIMGETSKLGSKDVGDMSLNPITPPTAKQLENQQKYLNYINQANLHLHKKFYLLKKEVELDGPRHGEEYSLPTDFMSPISAYYKEDLESVVLKNNSLDSIDPIITDDNFVSLVFNEPFKVMVKGDDEKSRQTIVLTYIASPKRYTNVSSDLGVSAAYTDAIINYAAYKAYTSISGAINDENNAYYIRYMSACKEIVNYGFVNRAADLNSKLYDRGFV